MRSRFISKAVTYHTSQGTYFAFHDDGNAVTAYKITPTNPPGIVSAWSMGQSGRGSPWVTTTDGTNNAIVWVAGVQGDQRLHGYNADTGAAVATYTYKVCNAGTQTCSNQVTVTF